MFTLTREERHVVLFLITIALLGIGIDFLAKKCLPAKSIAQFNQELGKIDLNSADKELLMSLPGIGEKLAGRIIEYRDEHAGFCKMEELKNIKGITESRYGKIKDYLIVE
jgi:competence ComEA-like helix-hairpin-helix protein